jgi:hypothetical protein
MTTLNELRDFLNSIAGWNPRAGEMTITEIDLDRITLKEPGSLEVPFKAVVYTIDRPGAPSRKSPFAKITEQN